MASKEITKQQKEKEKEVASPEEDENMFADGGYAWVILACCFLVCMISNGLAFSSGIFFVEFSKTFGGSSSAEVAWVLSLLRFFFMLVGPVGSILLTKLGGRITIIIGSTLIALGFVISAFAPVLGVLYFSFGFLTGAGLGMNYQAAVVIVNYHFLKRRGIANGIVGAGGGVGLLVFPLVINALLDSFGYLGAFLLLAGISLQGVLFGALVLPPEETLRMKKKAQEKSDLQKVSSVTDLVRQTAMIAKVTIKSHGHGFPENQKFPEDPLLKSHNCTLAFASSVQYKKQFDAADGPPPTISDHIKTVLRLTFDINEFKCPFFLIFTFTQLFFNFAFPACFVFIPARATVLGLNMQQSSFLISMSGIFSTISKFTSGTVADTKFMANKRLYLYAAGLLVGGSASIVNYGSGFEHQLTMAALLGCCGGAVYSLLSIVLADILGIERLTRAYGMISFLSAFAALGGPAISGVIFDSTGSYEIVFLILGSSLFMGGLVVFIIPVIAWTKGTKSIRCEMSETDMKHFSVKAPQPETEKKPATPSTTPPTNPEA